MSDVSEAILAGIKQINARLDKIDARIETVENRLAPIEGAVADIDNRLKSWPDMHYLSAAAKAQIAHTREMKADVADLKVRMDEIYQAMATDAEIRHLRDDIARFRDQSVDIDVRLGVVEGHLGLADKTPTP